MRQLWQLLMHLNRPEEVKLSSLNLLSQLTAYPQQQQIHRRKGLVEGQAVKHQQQSKVL